MQGLRVDRHAALILEALEREKAVQEEASNVGRAVMQTVMALRAGQLSPCRASVRNPRPK